MTRTLAVTCAAIMLIGALTACSTAAPTNDPNLTGPTGTTYNTAAGGMNEDRNVSGTRTSARTNQTNGHYHGRYAAFADGSLADDPNGGSTIGQDLARDVRDITRGINNAVRDMNRAGSNDVNNTGRNSPKSNDTNDIINKGYRSYSTAPNGTANTSGTRTNSANGNSGNVGTNVSTANDLNSGLE